MHSSSERTYTISFYSWKCGSGEGKEFFVMFDLPQVSSNRPRSIYQCSNMAPRLWGQTSIFRVVFFVFESLLGIERQKKLKKFTILTRKPRSHVRVLIYRTWSIPKRNLDTKKTTLMFLLQAYATASWTLTVFYCVSTIKLIFFAP